MKRIIAASRLAWREVGGQAYIIDPRDSTLHELDEVGSLIWKAIEASGKYDAVVRSITDEYEVSEDQAERDLVEFLGTLREKGLVEIKD